jgi:hypothetical protein
VHHLLVVVNDIDVLYLPHVGIVRWIIRTSGTSRCKSTASLPAARIRVVPQVFGVSHVLPALSADNRSAGPIAALIAGVVATRPVETESRATTTIAAIA